MIEVTSEVFYTKIGPLNAICQIENEGVFPYTNLFKLRNGKLLGKVVGSYTDGVHYRHPIIHTYYLTKP